MAGTTPEETLELVVTHVRNGDLAALLELYSADAVFLPDPATVATGRSAVEAGLGQLLSLRPSLTFSEERTLTAGDVALVTHRWLLQGVLPDGSPIEQQGRTINVLRREDDGQWRLAVDDPWDGTPPAST